jgi:hypothetical protein
MTKEKLPVGSVNSMGKIERRSLLGLLIYAVVGIPTSFFIESRRFKFEVFSKEELILFLEDREKIVKEMESELLAVNLRWEEYKIKIRNDVENDRYAYSSVDGDKFVQDRDSRESIPRRLMWLKQKISEAKAELDRR